MLEFRIKIRIETKYFGQKKAPISRIRLMISPLFTNFSISRYGSSVFSTVLTSSPNPTLAITSIANLNAIKIIQLHSMSSQG